jgi:hypothetical protein
MKNLTTMLLAMLASGAVFAAAHTAAPADAGANRVPDPKQSARCNSEVQARGLKGDERKAFLKTCMEGVANATVAPRSMSGADKPALETAKP